MLPITVWQYLLETQINNCIERADVRHIVRADAFKTYEVYQEERCDNQRVANKLQYLFADSSHISFALKADSAANCIFKNFEQTKIGWQEKRFFDILNLSKDNIIKINDLMRGKIKKLADAEIDCGESSSFVERTQNTFLAHAEGISFYFTSEMKSRNFHFVPILLTWGELKGFRRF